MTDKYHHTEEETTPEMQQLLTEALLRNKGQQPDTDTEWEKFIHRIEKKKTARRLQIYTWLSTAAAVVALLLLTLPFLLTEKAQITVYQAKPHSHEVLIIDQPQQEEAQDKHPTHSQKSVNIEMKTIVVPPGKIWHGTLADGTKVWLNADTRLTYPKIFEGPNREITLHGEAYFEVAHDSNHPFLVHAGNQVTHVLGTQFNIDSYLPEVTHITLVSGRIRVVPAFNHQTTKETNHLLLNTRGESASVTERNIAMRRVNVEDVVCWRDGIELFDDASLRDILFHIGTWYNMTVVCHDEKYLNMRLHYVYDRYQEVNETLKMLENISNIKFRIEKNTIFVD